MDAPQKLASNERWQHVNDVKKKGKTMEIFVPLGIMAAWIILQAWVLPRFGVKI
jgi:hypothetical protein